MNAKSTFQICYSFGVIYAFPISLYNHNPTRIYYSTYSFIGRIDTHAYFEICVLIYVPFVGQLFMLYLLIGRHKKYISDLL
jgi:hypothetical protein